MQACNQVSIESGRPRSRIGGAAASLAVAAALAAGSPALGSPPDYLLVPSKDTDNVLRYDGVTGDFVDEFVRHKSGRLNQPVGLIFGPHDHNLYVSCGYYGGPGQLRAVLRYDGTTGKFIDQFTEPGHLEKVNQLLFGPDGNLYVSNGHEGSYGGVVRFNGLTGAFIDDFVPPVAGRLRAPGGMVFGPSLEDPDRLDLYIASGWYGNVLRFHGQTGAFLGEFVNPARDGLGYAVGVTFGPEGHLYVATSGFFPPHAYGDPNGVVRYQGPHEPTPGALIGVFVPPGSGGLLDPLSLLFGPDGNGDGHQDLYVSNAQWVASYETKEHTSTVKRYDGLTGAFLDTFVEPDSGGLAGPWSLAFGKTDPMTLAYTGP